MASSWNDTGTGVDLTDTNVTSANTISTGNLYKEEFVDFDYKHEEIMLMKTGWNNPRKIIIRNKPLRKYIQIKIRNTLNN